jgi:hypothetical protein
MRPSPRRHGSGRPVTPLHGMPPICCAKRHESETAFAATVRCDPARAPEETIDGRSADKAAQARGQALPLAATRRRATVPVRNRCRRLRLRFPGNPRCSGQRHDRRRRRPGRIPAATGGSSHAPRSAERKRCRSCAPEGPWHHQRLVAAGDRPRSHAGLPCRPAAPADRSRPRLPVRLAHRRQQPAHGLRGLDHRGRRAGGQGRRRRTAPGDQCHARLRPRSGRTRLGVAVQGP